MKKLIHPGNNFSYLTVMLVFLLFISALAHQYADMVSSNIILIGTVAALIVCTYSIQTSQQRFLQSRLGIIVIIIGITTAEYFLQINGLFIAHLIFLSVFFSWIIWLAARQVLFTGSVDGNKVIGAISIYLLLGLIWAFLYMLVLEVAPGSFSGLPMSKGYDNFPAMLYFSYITLTTLGYGDISPTLPISQFITYMEAITGQFYIAIVVASLIGARFSQKRA